MVREGVLGGGGGGNGLGGAVGGAGPGRVRKGGTDIGERCKIPHGALKHP